MQKLFLLITIVIFLPDVKAQETKKIDSLSNRVLLERIEKLEGLIEHKEQENELEKLLQEASHLGSKEKKNEVDISKKFSSGVRQQQGLNPNLSVLGDFFGSYTLTIQILLLNLLIVHMVAMVFICGAWSYHLLLLLIPLPGVRPLWILLRMGWQLRSYIWSLLNLPLNMSLKGGVFFPEFGLLNRHHTHALPQFDRPRASVNYFGLDGFNGMGVSANFMLPNYYFPMPDRLICRL